MHCAVFLLHSLVIIFDVGLNFVDVLINRPCGGSYRCWPRCLRGDSSGPRLGRRDDVTAIYLELLQRFVVDLLGKEIAEQLLFS